MKTEALGASNRSFLSFVTVMEKSVVKKGVENFLGNIVENQELRLGSVEIRITVDKVSATVGKSRVTVDEIRATVGES